MGTLKEKFEYVEETKQKIREALEEMGATVTDEDTFRSYAEKIAEVHPDGLYIEKKKGLNILLLALTKGQGKILYLDNMHLIMTI